MTNVNFFEMLANLLQSLPLPQLANEYETEYDLS